MKPVLKGFLAGLVVGLIVYFISGIVPFLMPFAPVLALIAFGFTWYVVYSRNETLGF